MRAKPTFESLAEANGILDQLPSDALASEYRDWLRNEIANALDGVLELVPRTENDMLTHESIIAWWERRLALDLTPLTPDIGDRDERPHLLRRQGPTG